MAAPAATTAPYAPSRAGVDSAANRVSTPSSSCSNANGLSRPPCTNQSQRARSVGPSLIAIRRRSSRARASPSSPIHQGFHRRASTRRTSGSLAPALARTRATSGRPHRRAAVSDVNPRVVTLLRIVARRVVVGGVGVVVRIIIIAPACLVRSRAACESNANSNSTSAERPFDEHRWTKKNASERPSVRRAGRRCDDVAVSSPRALIPFHAIPCHAVLHSDRSIDRWVRECVVFVRTLCSRTVCTEKTGGWYVFLYDVSLVLFVTVYDARTPRSRSRRLDSCVVRVMSHDSCMRPSIDGSTDDDANG